MVVSWSASGLGQLAAGSPVWFRLTSKAQPDAPWQLGSLVATSDDSAQVQGSGRRAVPVTVPLKDVEPANPEMLQRVPDLTSLSHLNEPSILDALAQRYGEDVIYTTAGPVLIALNPCKQLPLYEASIVDEYRKVQSDLAAQTKEPHVFLNAGKAFRDMVDNQQSQSMVISGESGAGKTETTKKAMQFFAQMSGGHGIEDQVLQTNPLLEAFGNAKTLRNHNSSRFGKLLEIHFNRSNHICGAKISTYLLEKSRVVYQIPGERSFHIFYQLMRGASAEERSAWCLPAQVSDFKYLNGQGAVTTIDGVNDARDFKEVREAMAAVSIDEELQHQIFSIVSAVLWLGNVTFTAKSDDAVEVNKDAAFTTAACLLDVPDEALDFALTHRLMTVGNEKYEKSLNFANATDTRDALAKALYAALFSFIVDRVNSSLATSKQLSGRFIAILDIYGFESFTKNSFEQLCINYANERLQQQFNKHLFKLEQEEYDNEGIDWSHIDFEDNQDCLDCIDAKPPKGLGVMSVLDDQCNFPRSTDQSFSDTLRERITNGRFSYKPGSHTNFIIEHYAGPVTYDCTNFLDKNRDTLSYDLVNMLESTSSASVKALLPYVSAHLEGKNRATVASRFREQLLDLVGRLDTTEMHFVRCIKPNFHLSPDTFDQAMILQQLRCCGVLEVVRIAKAGYPTRYVHKQFASRYAELMPKQAIKGSAIDVCVKILDHFRVPETMWQIGNTKIFFKAGVLGTMEDLWRRTRGAVLVLQAYVRMWIARREFLRKRAAVTTIATARRGLVQRRRYGVMLKRHRAAIQIQTAARSHSARKERAARMAAVIAIQCAFRGWQLQKRCRKREKDMREQLQFAQARADRVQQALASAEERLAEWDGILAEFAMSGADVRAALTEWKAGVGSGANAAAAASSPVSVDLSRELEEYRKHRDAFNAWQNDKSKGAFSTVSSAGDMASDHEGGTNRSLQELQDIIFALRIQVEEEQQLRAELQSKNNELRRNSRSTPQGPSTPNRDHDRGGGGADARKGGNGVNDKPDPAQQGVQRVQADFDSHANAMDDDLAFIQEVAIGTSKAAPEFNAEQELRQLKDRFDRWKELFKTRMKETYHYVSRAQRHSSGRRPSRLPEPVNTRERRSANGSAPNGNSPPNGHTRSRDQEMPVSPTSSGGDSNGLAQRLADGMKTATKRGQAMVGRLQRRMSTSQSSPNDANPPTRAR